MSDAGVSDAKTIDLDGPVHYVDHGGSGAPVVLVHGLGGSHVNWCAVAPSLAKRHRVLAVDLPGFGLTRAHGRVSDVDSNARLLARFVDEVARAPATLIGNSMGGMLSLMAAAEAPASVRSLVLVNAALPYAPGARIDPQVAIMFSTYMIPWVGERMLAKYSAKLTAAQFVRQTMNLCAANARAIDPSYIDAHVALAERRRAADEWVREGQASFLAAARSLVHALLRGRVAKAIEAVRAPVLVMHGDRDRLVNVASARRVAERRGWEIEVLQGIGHIPQLETPGRFVDIVEDFLARHAIGEGARGGPSVIAT